MVLLSVALVGFSLRAQNTSSELEAKAKAILVERCAECHSPGGKKNKKPQLDALISMEALRNNTDYVVSGNAEQSDLFKRVTLPEGDDDVMPQSSGKAGDSGFREHLKPDEIATLKSWIEGAAPSPNSPGTTAERPFVSDENLIHAALKDLEQQSSALTPTIRYLSIANLYNQRDAKGNSLRSDAVLDLARQAINKLVNSMSSNGKLIKATPVDSQALLFRIQLSDYGWSREKWQHIESFYPYEVDHDNIEERRLKELTQTEVPLLRGDWFVFAVSQPPLYHIVLDIPKTLADARVERGLGIDVLDNLRQGRALRLGFRDSGVSTGARMLERHQNAEGLFYWKSYDFDELKHSEAGHDIFTSPLGPVGAGFVFDRKFIHDGGEMIWQLPNGLQAYLLTDNKGNRLNVGPSNIVRDETHPKGTIINGISCMSCHNLGMKTPKPGPHDQVRAIAEGLDLDSLDRANLEKLFAQGDVVKELLKQDGSIFGKALSELGIDPNGVEPVRAIYDIFAAPITAGTLQSEMGVYAPNFLDRLAKSIDNDVRAVALNLNNGQKLDRKFFADKFRHVALHLSFTPSQRVPRLPVEFGGKDEATDQAIPRVFTVPSALSPTIQSAISLAQRGDTVNVKNGQYQENLFIEEDIILQGESRDGVIITPPAGASSAILVINASPRIENLTLVSYGKELDKALPVVDLEYEEGFELAREHNRSVVEALSDTGRLYSFGLRKGATLIGVDGVEGVLANEIFYLAARHKAGERIYTLFKNPDGNLVKLVLKTKMVQGSSTQDGLVLLHSAAQIKNVYISHFPGIGLLASGSQAAGEWKLDNVATFKNDMGAKIRETSGTIVDSVFAQNTEAGLQLAPESKAEISASRFDSNGLAGLYINKNSSARIRGSVFGENTNIGLGVDQGGKVEIADSEVSKTSNGFGMLVRSAQSVKVTNCRFNQNSKTGLFVRGVSNGVEVSKSVAEKNGANGFDLSGIANVTLQSCQANENKKSGFLVSGDKPVSMKNCMANSNGHLGFGFTEVSKFPKNFLEDGNHQKDNAEGVEF